MHGSASSACSAPRACSYSVPSRLARPATEGAVYSDALEAWLGGGEGLRVRAAARSTADRHPRRIDFRHMLPALKRKPGAFVRWVLRDAMFPRSEYAQTWQQHQPSGCPTGRPAD